jgi:membrane protein implicated in regulation of membrane protease activity
MNRTTAIIVTIVTALLCGIPSLVLLCLGVLALFGAQMPEVMAQNPGSTPEEIMLGAGMFLCFGAVLLVIPILVGVFSFRLSKKEETAIVDYVPPSS